MVHCFKLRLFNLFVNLLIVLETNITNNLLLFNIIFFYNRCIKILYCFCFTLIKSIPTCCCLLIIIYNIFINFCFFFNFNRLFFICFNLFIKLSKSQILILIFNFFFLYQIRFKQLFFCIFLYVLFYIFLLVFCFFNFTLIKSSPAFFVCLTFLFIKLIFCLIFIFKSIKVITQTTCFFFFKDFMYQIRFDLGSLLNNFLIILFLTKIAKIYFFTFQIIGFFRLFLTTIAVIF
jgi:hypothetical protein